MRHFLFAINFCLLLSFGCSNESVRSSTNFEIPIINHNLSYIPYDAQLDKVDYVVCDSTRFGSGRSRLQYVGGINKFKEDITANYLYKTAYQNFNGYIVIRFLVNCEGKSGRYRAQSLNLDFSPTNAPADLLESSIALVKSLDHWEKRSTTNQQKEYSKFINLKFQNGKIQHVLL